MISFLSVEVAGHLLALVSGQLLEFLFRHGEHAAGAAGAVIEQVGAGFDLGRDRHEDQLGHQLHGITRGPVLAGLLVVLLVEAAHQLLKHRAHAVVVEAGVLLTTVTIRNGIRAEVDVGREELADQGAEGIGLRQARDLVAELEVLQDVLHVGRKAIEVGLEVGPQLLLDGAGLEIAQGEFGGVVEGLARCLPQGRVLVDDLGGIQGGLQVQHRLLGGLQHRIQPPQHRHRQDHVAVLAAHVQIPEHIVGNAPDEVGDPVELALFHGRPLEPMGCRAALRMPQAWAGWVDWVPHGPGSWSQEHRWAAPARAFGWSAPVGAWFLAPHPLASSIACLASGSRAQRGHSAGGTPGPCLLRGLKLVHLAAGRPPDAPAMLFSAPSAPAAAISRRSATHSWICSSLVGEIP